MTEIILYSEVNLVCIIVMGIIAFDVHTAEFKIGTRPRVLCSYMVFTMMFYVLDIVGKIMRTGKYEISHSLNYWLDVMYFTVFIISAMIWFTYSLVLHSRSIIKVKYVRMAIATPVVCVVILYIISYFTGWVFSINPDGTFNRGPIFYIHTAISFGYLLVAGIVAIYYAVNYRKSNPLKRDECVKFAIYSIVMFMAGILQFRFGRFPLLVTASAIASLTMYLNYLGQVVSLDPLTDIPNRRKVMYYIEEKSKALKDDEELYLMFVDVDDFKVINDTYGHDEGDKVLTDLTRALKNFCRKNDCLCGRLGGDEFAVVQVKKKCTYFDTDKRIEKYVADRDIVLSDDKKLTFSLGYAKYNNCEDDVDSLIERADQEMYKKKKQKKASRK